MPTGDGGKVSLRSERRRKKPASNQPLKEIAKRTAAAGVFDPDGRYPDTDNESDSDWDTDVPSEDGLSFETDNEGDYSEGDSPVGKPENKSSSKVSIWTQTDKRATHFVMVSKRGPRQIRVICRITRDMHSGEVIDDQRNPGVYGFNHLCSQIPGGPKDIVLSLIHI